MKSKSFFVVWGFVFEKISFDCSPSARALNVSSTSGEKIDSTWKNKSKIISKLILNEWVNSVNAVVVE